MIFQLHILLVDLPTDVSQVNDTPVAWVAVVMGLLLCGLAVYHAKYSSDKSTEIRELNAEHIKHNNELNAELRKLQSDYSQQFLEYSQMLHNAVKEVSNVQPSLRDDLNALEKSMKDYLDKIQDRLSAIIEKGK